MVVLQLVTYYWYFQSYTLSYEIIMAIYHFHIDLNIVHLLTLKHFFTVIPRGTEHGGDVNFSG